MQITKLEVRNSKERKSHKTRVHVFLDETIIENLENRRCRPYSEWRKLINAPVRAALHLPAAARLRWSQKAGCRCGCSPGFIVEGGYSYQRVVYIDIK